MKNIDLTFKAITPMFKYGADGKSLEFRIPSVKGMMRYWYRAMNANNSLDKLKKKEALLFGGTDNKLDKKIGKSRINLLLLEKTRLQSSYEPLFFKEERDSINWNKNKRETQKQGYSPGSSFTIRVSSKDEEDRKKGENIIELASVLGGFGQRSRRGYGSIQLLNGDNSVKNYDSNSILNLMNDINPGLYNYNKPNNLIRINNNNITNGNYPYIKSIQLSKLICKDIKEILEDIIFHAHTHNSDHTGYATHGRLASPIYVSVIKDGDGYRIIVTRLNAVGSRGRDTSQDFINALMSIENDDKKEQ